MEVIRSTVPALRGRAIQHSQRSLADGVNIFVADDELRSQRARSSAGHGLAGIASRADRSVAASASLHLQVAGPEVHWTDPLTGLR